MLSLERSPVHEDTMIRTVASRGHLQRYITQNLFKTLQEQNVTFNLVSTRYLSQNLPKFPVPPLMQTLDKYLISVKPFLDQNEFETTKGLVKEFMREGSTGQKLQKLLEEKAQTSENWLADWWVHAAYLAYRDPCVIYSNPGQTFPLIDFHTENDRLQYAANVILGAAEYKTKIDGNEIPEEKMGNAPLDMQQYKKVFGTCRIPGEAVDSLQYNRFSKHIAIAHNNHWFRLDLYTKEGKIISKKQIMEVLMKIMESSRVRAEDAVGILTSENRDTWGRIHKVLISDNTNQLSISDIQTSMFVLCLDNPMDQQPGESRQSMQSRQMIHGGGSKFNSGNRWFDKTIQFIIGKDGSCGICYEHTPAEGGPVAVLTDYVVNYAKSDSGNSIPDAECAVEAKRLIFKITPDIQKDIATAKTNIDKLVADLETCCFTFADYGKDFIKSQRLSPDSYIQMALQYTFYRIHKTPGGHYESAGLRKYIHGRTETIRSTSVESINFARAMLDSNKSAAERVEALKEAINAHKKYTLDAVNGKGCDRHLLGLKLLALEKGIQLPALYQDVSFNKSTHMRISSSQVATKCNAFMTYAPLVPDGYGACYNPRDTDINFACSAFKQDPTTSARNFANQLATSLLDMQSVLAITQKSKL